MRAMVKLSLPQLQVPGMEGHPEIADATLPRDKLWSSGLQLLDRGMWIQSHFQIMQDVQKWSLPRQYDSDEAETFDFHIPNQT